MEKIFKRMGLMAKKAFPDATEVEHLLKLKDEVEEVIAAPKDLTEYADCILCLFGAASKAGFEYYQLEEAVRNKLFICENRKWNKKENGTYQHVAPSK